MYMHAWGRGIAWVEYDAPLTPRVRVHRQRHGARDRPHPGGGGARGGQGPRCGPRIQGGDSNPIRNPLDLGRGEQRSGNQTGESGNLVNRGMPQVDDRSEERLSALLNLYGVTSLKSVQLPVLLAAAEYSRK